MLCYVSVMLSGFIAESYQ